jgi:hypothetical protein
VPPPAPPPVDTPARGAPRRGPSLPVILGIVILAALASGLATYLATRGSDSTATPPASLPIASTATTTTPTSTGTTATTATSTTATTSTPTTTTFTGPAGALVAMFKDPAVASTCKKSPHPGGKATLNCTSTTPGGQPVALHVDLFGSSKFIQRNSRDDALGPYKAAGGTPAAGACSKTAWSGEGPWARGRRACFVATSTVAGCKGLGAPECSIISWYDEPSHVAVRATVPGGHAQSAPELSAWWNAHKGDFGG